MAYNLQTYRWNYGLMLEAIENKALHYRTLTQRPPNLCRPK